MERDAEKVRKCSSDTNGTWTAQHTHILLIVSTSFAGISALLYGFWGLCIALLVVLMGTLCEWTRLKSIRWVMHIGQVLLIWVLFVHWTHEVWVCPSCGLAKGRRVDLEVMRVAVKTRSRSYASLIYLVANDFGCPCPHEAAGSWEIVEDYWGMRFLAQDNGCSPYLYSDLPSSPESFDARYVRDMQSEVRQFASEHPEVVEEFCSRAIGQGDREYAFSVIYKEILKEEFHTADAL